MGIKLAQIQKCAIITHTLTKQEFYNVIQKRTICF